MIQQKEYRPFVLSGGGARGFAHLGVLKAFEENNIFPEAIAATSAGAIAAAFLCDGFTTDELKELFLRSKIGLSMQWRNWRSGLLSLEFVEQILSKNLRHKNFEALSIPLFITATNFNNGQQQLFNQGTLIPAIIAASSIPVVFPPIVIDNIPYVDGGLSGNLPVEPLAEKYNSIIGVHVNPLAPYKSEDGIRANLDRAMHLGIREAVLRNKSSCTHFIEPDALGIYGIFDFKQFEAIYQTGLIYTRSYISKNIASI